MTAQAELDKAYTEWRRLVEAEGEAILAGNWSFVADCQRALTKLRPIIDRLNDQARPGLVSSSSDSAGRDLILGLIDLERRNLSLLQQRREKLSAHIAQLSRCGRNLRGIQRSYASPTRSAWTSYS